MLIRKPRPPHPAAAEGAHLPGLRIANLNINLGIFGSISVFASGFISRFNCTGDRGGQRLLKPHISKLTCLRLLGPQWPQCC